LIQIASFSTFKYLEVESKHLPVTWHTLLSARWN